MATRKSSRVVNGPRRMHGTRGGDQLNVSVVPQLENVYLHDVDAPAFLTEVDFDKFGRTNGWFEWFSQGLTPQELIAPMKFEFFNNSWYPLEVDGT